MSYEVTIVKLPPQPVASIRFQAKMEELPSLMGPAYDEVLAHLREAGGAAGALKFTRAHSFGEALDLEAGYAVPTPAPGGGRIQSGQLPGGDAAKVEMTGSYAGLGEAVGALYAWVGSSGREAAGGHWELYLSDEAATPESELRTELYLPLKPE